MTNSRIQEIQIQMKQKNVLIQVNHRNNNINNINNNKNRLKKVLRR